MKNKELQKLLAQYQDDTEILVMADEFCQVFNMNPERVKILRSKVSCSNIKPDPEHGDGLDYFGNIIDPERKRDDENLDDYPYTCIIL
jgi:hypothetical protein